MSNNNTKPSETEVKQAINTLIKWLGDNPDREGLKDTPNRLMRAYQEWFSGYNKNYKEEITTFFQNNYNDTNYIILLKDIDFFSHCEHHFAPIIGRVHVGYIADKKIIGISKIARLVEIFARRLQIQEKLTSQISLALNDLLSPKGIAVAIEASHQCIASRGVNKNQSSMYTSKFIGIMQEQNNKQEFLQLISRS